MAQEAGPPQMCCPKSRMQLIRSDCTYVMKGTNTRGRNDSNHWNGDKPRMVLGFDLARGGVYSCRPPVVEEDLVQHSLYLVHRDGDAQCGLGLTSRAKRGGTDGCIYPRLWPGPVTSRMRRESVVYHGTCETRQGERHHGREVLVWDLEFLEIVVPTP
jgi:hypothetical protein